MMFPNDWKDNKKTWTVRFQKFLQGVLPETEQVFTAVCRYCRGLFQRGPFELAIIFLLTYFTMLGIFCYNYGPWWLWNWPFRLCGSSSTGPLICTLEARHGWTMNKDRITLALSPCNFSILWGFKWLGRPSLLLISNLKQTHRFYYHHLLISVANINMSICQA